MAREMLGMWRNPMPTKKRRARSPKTSSKLILHDGAHCLVFDQDGDVTYGEGRGLYFDDIRYLSRWEMRLDGHCPQGLGVRVFEPNQSVCVVTNPKLEGVRRETLGIVRKRILDGGVREEIAVTNHGDETASFELSFILDADFRDVSQVENAFEKGEPVERPEGFRAQALEGHRGLVLEWDSKGIKLATEALFEPPVTVRKQEAVFRIEIAPGEEQKLYSHIVPMAISDERRGGRLIDMSRDSAALSKRQPLERRILERMPKLDTDHAVLRDAYAHALRDMASLAMTQIEGLAGEGRTVAAGVPWYTALFGRDSLTAARLMLLADPDLTLGTLQILGQLQGKAFDESTSEQPGKILHAYRRNLAKGESQRYSRYKTLDATPLYLLTACELVRHQGDLGIFESLWPTLEKCVEWIERFGDMDGDGLLEKDSTSGGGWKDSSDSVRYRDGRIVEPPVALVEIQGYTARAFENFSDLCERTGRHSLAVRTRQHAARIREELLARYWMEDRSFFAQALDGKKQKVDSLTSNAGQLLWCRVIPDEYARKVADVLMTEAFFSGWGIRTRASSEGGFNPVSYHNGSVWPHDSGIIVSGLASYGYREEAKRVMEALLEATSHYPALRPPEVFAGYPKEPWQMPVAYFGANPLQAWASASIVEMVRTLLGLDVDAVERRLSLHPFALEDMSYLSWQGVHIGGRRTDIEVRFEGGKAEAEVHGLSDDWQIEGARTGMARPLSLVREFLFGGSPSGG